MLLRPPRISGANRTSFKSGMDSSFSGDIELDQLRGRSGQVSPLKPPKLGEGVGNMGAKVPKIGQGVQPVSPTLQDANTLIPQKPTGISIDQEVMDEVNRMAMGEQQVAFKPTVVQQPPRLGTQDEYGNVIDVSAGGGYAANVPQVASTGAAPRLAQTATQPIIEPIWNYNTNELEPNILVDGVPMNPNYAIQQGLLTNEQYMDYMDLWEANPPNQYVNRYGQVVTEQPQGEGSDVVTPQQVAQGGGFEYNRLIAQGYTPEQAWAALSGVPLTYGVPLGTQDEYGNVIDVSAGGGRGAMPIGGTPEPRPPTPTPPRLGTQDEYGNVIDVSAGGGVPVVGGTQPETQPGTQPPWVGGFGAVPGAGESRWDEELIQGIRNVYDAEMDAALKEIRKQDAGMERELSERNMGFGSSAVYAALDETRKQGARAALSDARTQNAVNKAHEIGNEMIRQAEAGDAAFESAITRIANAAPGEVSALLTSTLVPAMRRAGYSEDEILAMTNTLAEEAWHGSLQLGIEDILERNPEASEADLIAWVQTQRYPNGGYPTEQEARAWLEANKPYVEALRETLTSGGNKLPQNMKSTIHTLLPDLSTNDLGNVVYFISDNYNTWELDNPSGRALAAEHLSTALNSYGMLPADATSAANDIIDALWPPE